MVNLSKNRGINQGYKNRHCYKISNSSSGYHNISNLPINNYKSTYAKYLTDPSVINYKLLFWPTQGSSNDFAKDIKINGSSIFTTNPLTDVFSFSPYFCECNHESLFNKQTHDMNLRGKCLRAYSNLHENKIKNDLIFDLRVLYYSMETSSGIYMCHAINYAQPEQIIATCNYLQFMCPVCLEHVPTKNSLIQQCGHVICQDCSIKLLGFVKTQWQKKYVMFDCVVCRHKPDFYGRGSIIV